MTIVRIKKGQDKENVLKARALVRKSIYNPTLFNTEEYKNSFDVYGQQLSEERWSTLKEIINKNIYKFITSPGAMEKMVSKSRKDDSGSFSELVFPTKPDRVRFPRQSIMIKMGNVVEKSISDFLSMEFEDLRPELEKDLKRQLDLGLRVENRLEIAEIKCNFNLDTEKNPAVKDKLEKITSFFSESKNLHKYKNVDKCNVSFVNFRYPKMLANKHPEDFVKYGYQEFLDRLGFNLTQVDWESFMEEVGEKINESFHDEIDSRRGQLSYAGGLKISAY